MSLHFPDDLTLRLAPPPPSPRTNTGGKQLDVALREPESAPLCAASAGTRAAHAHHGCTACRQVFPEQMMAQVQGRWLCQLCRERALGDIVPKGQRRYRMAQASDFAWMPKAGLALILLLIFGRLGLLFFFTSGRDPHITPTEPWARKSPAQWPQLVLTNEPWLRGERKLPASSGCLVQREDGTVFGMTAARLLLEGKDDGIEKHTIGELQDALVEWRMYPGNKPDQFVSFTKTHGDPAALLDSAVLLFATPPNGSLPATPLKLRPSPVSLGTKLHVVASQGAERRQAALPARVVMALGTMFEVALERPVDCTGFCGAPIIDGRGHLAGWVAGPADELEAPGHSAKLTAVGAEFFRAALK